MPKPPRCDHRSAAALAYRKWYGTRRWRRRALAQIREEPFCRMCLERTGVYVVATVADHVRPHRGDPVAFWGGDLQSLCAPCHDGDKQREELMARPLTVDQDGWPLRRADADRP